MNIKKSEIGFTMMELLVVVIILGVIAGFAIPNYQRSVLQAHERDMANQLRVIHAASLMYRAQTGAYLIGNISDDQINDQLGLSLMTSDGGTFYNYFSVDGTTFQAEAERTSEPGNGAMITVTDAPLSDTNPCCLTQDCEIVPDC